MSCCTSLIRSVFVTAGLVASTALAQTDTSDGEIRLTSDAIEGTLNEYATLIGNVKLTQPNLELNADQMSVTWVDGDIQTIVAEGDPVNFAQSKPNSVTASAELVTYTPAENKLVLSGDVELNQRGNQIRSDRIEYDIVEGELLAAGEDKVDGQQVEIVLDRNQ